MKIIYKILSVIMMLCMSFASLANASEVIPMGDDGLHKPKWLEATFKDMNEDLAEATSQGKRLLVIFEQRGCIYCNKLHEEIFTNDKIKALIVDKYYVTQMNLFGDEEVTDFDGDVLSEKDMAIKWGIVFTPTLMFFPEENKDRLMASKAAVMTMPGAFDKYTTLNLFNFVLDKRYEEEEHFQKYHARMLKDQLN